MARDRVPVIVGWLAGLAAGVVAPFAIVWVATTAIPIAEANAVRDLLRTAFVLLAYVGVGVVVGSVAGEGEPSGLNGFAVGTAALALGSVVMAWSAGGPGAFAVILGLAICVPPFAGVWIGRRRAGHTVPPRHGRPMAT